MSKYISHKPLPPIDEEGGVQRQTLRLTRSRKCRASRLVQDGSYERARNSLCPYHHTRLLGLFHFRFSASSSQSDGTAITPSASFDWPSFCLTHKLRLPFHNLTQLTDHQDGVTVLPTSTTAISSIFILSRLFVHFSSQSPSSCR